ncbi:hypothetical protein RJ640_002696 [Escallonia rubra]|uniref:Reverse transcriptase Ty1/copia-type domain-containing protein n=1 Tax=Escallonia rubra TaxID=112253 RepID=A0AA88UDB8_9ASTE|nr:hypothetical protein RJ640_002696 [Escallonia rubra]
MAEKCYIRNVYDICVYHQRLANDSHIYLLLYVDDMLIAAKSMSDVNGLKEQLKREFEMKDLGATNRILGMEIQRDRPAGILYLSQKKYIKRILQRFVFTPTHSYKSRQVLTLVVDEEGVEDTSLMCDEEEQLLHETKHEEDDERVEIIVNANTGNSSQNTLKLQRKHGKKRWWQHRDYGKTEKENQI